MQLPTMDNVDEWIEEQTKILNTNQNHQREPLKYIQLHFCYTDSNDCIMSLKTEKHFFDNATNEDDKVVDEATLMRIIDEHKTYSNMHFVFKELATFHVDLEPEHINSFDPSNTTFFKPLPIVSDVSFSKSIYIFHPLNSLFFLFKQRSSLKQPHKATKSMKKVVFSSKKFTRRIYL
jgi:hypothetical protein